MRNLLISITGPSCAGKTTFANKLITDVKYEYVPTYTTRPPRDDESDKHYIFMTDEGFDEAKEEGLFLETNYYDGNLYGTTIDSLKDIWEEKRVAVKVLDPNGVSNLETFTDKLDFTLVKVWIGISDSLFKEREAQRENKRNLEWEKAWYKRHNWNYVIKELRDDNIDNHISKLSRLLPTFAAHEKLRIWGT